MGSAVAQISGASDFFLGILAQCILIKNPHSLSKQEVADKAS